MDVCIIGGGAAGLMAAATVLEQNPGASVTLVERNDRLGKKVIISGGGSCNVTTGMQDVNVVLTRYPRGARFLSFAMHRFPPAAVVAWFESRGVPLKTQTDLRVFPQSDNGHDVVNVFNRLFQASHVTVLLKHHVVRVAQHPEGFALHLKGEAEPRAARKLVLTTGGQAYRQTGSTGDGYAFARSLGHSITQLAPSLSSFTTRETWPAEVAGLSFPWANLTAQRPGRKTFTGSFLFTHRGVSGPAVFALSSLVAFEPFSATEPLGLRLNLFPETTTAALRQEIAAAVTANPKKSWGNVLGALVPKSLAEVACRELNLPPERHAAEVGRKGSTAAATWLTAIPLTVVGRGAGDEFVTAGGVNLKEVNPSTMESRLCPGLYFAGEILDVDGFTGGFNLQASWATGHLAGESAATNT